VPEGSERQSGHPERQRGGGGKDHPLAGGTGGGCDSAEGEGEHREERTERPALGWGGHRPDAIRRSAGAGAAAAPEAVILPRGRSR